MILGLGTDIVEIQRINDSLQRLGDKFSKRILTETEHQDFKASKQPAAFLAKRFAAKEAAVKALGTGIGNGVSFQHFEVGHDAFGAPLLTISGYARELCQQRAVQYAHLSISDESHYAVATVILET